MYASIFLTFARQQIYEYQILFCWKYFLTMCYEVVLPGTSIAVYCRLLDSYMTMAALKLLGTISRPNIFK